MEREHSDGAIMLNWIFKKWDGEALTELLWLRIRTSGGACECANERWVLLNAGSFLTC
jgi:hypothetical protein